MAQVESLQLLMVSETYRIESGKVVIGEPKKHRFYQPFEFPELPGRLAEVRDRDGALGFVRQWGLLGFSELSTRSLSAEQRREFHAHHGEWGDPLDWIWAHAQNARILLKLISLLKTGDPEPISGYLDKLTAETPPPLEGSLLTYASPTSIGVPLTLGQAIEGPKHAAAVVVNHILNQNSINYVSPRTVIVDEKSGAMARSHTASALLPVIYTHMSEAAVGASSYYRCAYRNCQRWWPVNYERPGPRNLYCPADYGEESRCSRKARYHRKRNT